MLLYNSSLLKKITSNNFLSDLIILLFFMFLSGIFSLYLGNGTDEFDAYNYHFYNPWALFHDRYNIDILPCGIRSYFNPLLEIPTYILLSCFNNFPKIFIFLQGTIYGILLFFSYKLVSLFKIEDICEKICFRITCIILVAISPFLMPLVGTIYVDFQVAIIILAALYIYLKNIYSNENKSKYTFMIITGILLGAVSGLKPSSNIMIISMLIASLFLIKYIKNPKKSFIYISIGFLAGFSIFNIFWYYKIWNIFHNPIFPYFNNFFHSIYGQDAAVFFDSYVKEIPNGFINKLLYPFTIYVKDEFNWFGVLFYPFNDILIPIATVVIPLMLVKSLIKKDDYNQQTLLFLIYFVIVTYLLWLNIFCILRFIIAVLIVSVILIVYTLYSIIHRIVQNRTSVKKSKYAKLLIILPYILFIVLSITFSKTDLSNYHKPISQKIFETPVMTEEIEDNSIVLLSSQALSYIIPFLNEKAKYIYLIMPLHIDIADKSAFYYDETRTVDYYYSKYYEDRIKEEINSNKNIYLMVSTRSYSEWSVYKEIIQYYREGDVKYIQIGETPIMKIYKLEWS